MMAYDLSEFDELSREDLRILESHVTRNFGAVWSKPKRLSLQDEERLQEILFILFGYTTIIILIEFEERTVEYGIYVLPRSSSEMGHF